MLSSAPQAQREEVLQRFLVYSVAVTVSTTLTYLRYLYDYYCYLQYYHHYHYYKVLAVGLRLPAIARKVV